MILKLLVGQNFGTKNSNNKNNGAAEITRNKSFGGKEHIVTYPITGLSNFFSKRPYSSVPMSLNVNFLLVRTSNVSGAFWRNHSAILNPSTKQFWPPSVSSVCSMQCKYWVCKS